MRIGIGKIMVVVGILIAMIGALTMKDIITLIGFGLPCVGIVVDSFESLSEQESGKCQQ